MVRPPAPSPRVWTTAAIAAVIGALTFAIWWMTAPAPVPGPEGPGLPTTANQESALRRDKPADALAIPRGDTLTGSLTPLHNLVHNNAERDLIAIVTQATLVRVNRSTDELEPWLAESWSESNPDTGLKAGPTYVLKLRPGIAWSDGTPFTAADAVASLRASSSSLQVLGKPLAVRATNPLEVEITFPAPFAPGLRVLENVPIARPPTPVEAPGVGLGPFVLKERSEAALRFERNPHYWRTAPDGKPLPYLDSLVLRKVPDQNAELKELIDGQLDFIESEIRPEDYTTLTRAEQERKIRLYDLGPGLDGDALWLNVSRAWLAKDDFRLAISAAINRRAFCDAVYLGACDPIYSPIATGNPGWFNPDLPVTGPNAETALAMLAGLGLQYRSGDGILGDDKGRPVRFVVFVQKGLTRARLGASFVRDELRKIGIGVDVVELDPGVLAERRAKGDYDAIYDRREVRDTDPAMDLDLWTSWQATDWGRQIADLVRKQAGTTDRVQRVQLFADAQKIFVQHMPAIYLGAPYKYVATSPRVLNAKPSRQWPALLWNAEMLAAIAR